MKQLPTIHPNGHSSPANTVIADADAARFAPMFKALGDPVRLRLIALIAAQDEICVCNLTPHFALSGPTISHHLRQLREAGLIESERRGTWIYYRVSPDALSTLGGLLHVAAKTPGLDAGIPGSDRCT